MAIWKRDLDGKPSKGRPHFEGATTNLTKRGSSPEATEEPGDVEEWQQVCEALMELKSRTEATEQTRARAPTTRGNRFLEYAGQ